MPISPRKNHQLDKPQSKFLDPRYQIILANHPADSRLIMTGMNSNPRPSERKTTGVRERPGSWPKKELAGTRTRTKTRNVSTKVSTIQTQSGYRLIRTVETSLRQQPARQSLPRHSNGFILTCAWFATILFYYALRHQLSRRRYDAHTNVWQIGVFIIFPWAKMAEVLAFTPFYISCVFLAGTRELQTVSEALGVKKTPVQALMFV